MPQNSAAFLCFFIRSPLAHMTLPISQYNPPTTASGAENGTNFSSFHCFTRTLCQVPLRSSVPGISHQSDRATQMVSMNSQSKNSAPRNSA